jgi:hypothetical protein
MQKRLSASPAVDRAPAARAALTASASFAGTRRARRPAALGSSGIDEPGHRDANEQQSDVIPGHLAFLRDRIDAPPDKPAVLPTQKIASHARRTAIKPCLYCS